MTLAVYGIELFAAGVIFSFGQALGNYMLSLTKHTYQYAKYRRTLTPELAQQAMAQERHKL